MLRRTRFYIGISLLVQSLTFMILVIIFLFRNKKNTAGAFCAMGIIGGITGAILVAKQFREQCEDDRIIEVIDELCSKDYHRDIPVDDTASEDEFN